MRSKESREKARIETKEKFEMMLKGLEHKWPDIREKQLLLHASGLDLFWMLLCEMGKLIVTISYGI